MRVMGGLRRKIPVTFWTMTAGVFAIAGLFPFSGFFSKDAILYATFLSTSGGKIFWLIGVATVFLTSFYMFRLWYLTFFGEERTKHVGADGHHSVHESPWSMLSILVLLAVLSLAGGWMGWPQSLGGADRFAHYLDPVFRAEPASYEQVSIAMATGIQPTDTGAPVEAQGNPRQERMLSGVALLIALAGWFFADIFYRRRRDAVAREDARTGGFFGLLRNKYWIDELYGAVFVQPLSAFSRVVLWRGVDEGVVDGAGGVAAESAVEAGQLVRRVQSGNIRSYAGWLALGAAAVLVVVLYLEHI
jgi:NADH-quinone oxidoreductase subunit L